MGEEAKKSWAVVFTIGHSNHEPGVFVELLRRHGVEVLVDVRSSPYSKYASQFNHDSLKAVLNRAGIKHAYMGRELGGMPEGAEFYDGEGYVLYGRLAALGTFQEGIGRVIDGAGRVRMALMCSEEDPGGCHRRLLLARVLRERGVEVRHIRGDGSVQNEEELEAEEKSRQKDAGQGMLFDMGQVKEWKSIQSVLPRKQPPSSSER